MPCASSAGVRKVLAEESYSTQAGKYEPCYQMSDFYNSGSPIQVFCDGVGIVAEKFDHAGSRFGYSKELIQFSVPPAFLTTITPTAPAPDLQISELARWGKGAISASEFSPDGQRLGVVTTQGAYIYDAASLAQLDFIPNASAWPVVAFSPDWSLLAMGSGSTVTCCIREANWKYARYFDPSGTAAEEYEIYKLDSDPNELNNLAGNPAYASDQARLALKLAQVEDARSNWHTYLPLTRR